MMQPVVVVLLTFLTPMVLLLLLGSLRLCEDIHAVMMQQLKTARSNGDEEATAAITRSNCTKVCRYEDSSSNGGSGRANREELDMSIPAVATTTGVQAGSRSRDGALWTYKAFVVHGAPKNFKAIVEVNRSTLCNSFSRSVDHVDLSFKRWCDQHPRNRQPVYDPLQRL
jgi:hypothetical protein